MSFNSPTCFYDGSFECTATSAGAVVLLVLVLAVILCGVLCLRRQRRRSRNISGNSVGKPASNEYKIESLHPDTDDRSRSGATNPQAGSSNMKDFQNISLQVDSFNMVADGEDIRTTNIRSIPLELPSAQNPSNSACPSSHRYDDVRRPYDTVTSVDHTLSFKPPKSDAYSEATTHTLVLSNTDNQGKPGHTYHLLDGSNPTEKATVVAVGSRSKESSLKTSNMTSGILATGNYETTHSRRTTLSGPPTKPEDFDDPTYANTSASFPSGSKNSSQSSESRLSVAGPTRSRSLVHSESKRNHSSNRMKQRSATNEPLESPAFMQHMSTVFDDPTYDVGLNLKK